MADAQRAGEGGGSAMTAKRLKTAAAEWPVPQTIEEANRIVAQIGESQRDLAMLEAEMNERLAEIKALYEKEATHKREFIDLHVKGLRIWCEANRAVLLKGDAKSAELPAGIVGWRTRPARVVLKDVERVIEWLVRMAMEKFLRRKVEVDKEAMLKEPAEAEKVPGVEIRKGEEFYV